MNGVYDAALIDAAITNVLMSMVKTHDAPASAESHLCRVVDILLAFDPSYSTSDPELADMLDFARGVMRLHRGG